MLTLCCSGWRLQVWTQPFLMACERGLEKQFPGNAFLNASFELPVGKGKSWNIRYYILVWRTLYVCFTTVIACLAPFFNDIVGARLPEFICETWGL